MTFSGLGRDYRLELSGKAPICQKGETAIRCRSGDKRPLTGAAFGFVVSENSHPR
jgi:hypothetical protein